MLSKRQQPCPGTVFLDLDPLLHSGMERLRDARGLWRSDEGRFKTVRITGVPRLEEADPPPTVRGAAAALPLAAECARSL